MTVAQHIRRFWRLRFLGLSHESQERRARPSCVMLQIDGLSRRAFENALRGRRLPFLRRLLRDGETVAGGWRSMLPTSTSAFQLGLFYGDNDDVPGFFWYDKRRGRPIRMNGAGDTARIEQEVRERVAPTPGLLTGGSSYSALFDGGADNTLLTFSRLFSPRYNVSIRLAWLALFALSQALLLARMAYYTAIEFLLAFYDLATGLLTERNKFIELKFVFPRVVSVVWCREIAALAAILDIMRGVGPIYINFFAYDEHAHHRGPDSRFAFWSLRGTDAAIRRIWRAARMAERLGVRQYDVYVWSDHGQTPTVPFRELRDRSPERHFDGLFRSFRQTDHLAGERVRNGDRDERMPRGRYLRGQRDRQSAGLTERLIQRGLHLQDLIPGPLGRLFVHLLRDAGETRAQRDREEEGDERRRLRLISTGPVAHLYLLEDEAPWTWEDWRERYPEFLEAMAGQEEVGFVLARRRDGGAMLGLGGQWRPLEAFASGAAPGREEQEKRFDDALAAIRARADDLRRWAEMTSAGDMILFGLRGGGRACVSFSYEQGGHAGPSEEETTPFIVVPARRAGRWPELDDPEVGEIGLADLRARLREVYGDDPGKAGEAAP